MFSISPSAILRYTRSLQEAVATQVAAKHKTPYSFRSEVAFVYFKASESGAASRFI